MTDGVEISYATDGKIFVDFESYEFKPWRQTFLMHYAEYRNWETGEAYWKTYNRVPKMSNMYKANNVVRKNEDGSYEYIKNRHDGQLRKLTDEEVVWLLLKVGG